MLFYPGLSFAFPIPSQYTELQIAAIPIIEKSHDENSSPVSSATTPNQWSISDEAVKERKYRCDDKDASSSSAEISRSSSLDGFFFKKDLQKWSYRHELVDDEDSDDENEVID
ncbi:hypothetical protein Q3G72_014138 [Acer saccharum]|nr:hypothetical protein Q3G72_014138 [Acer saccharum]